MCDRGRASLNSRFGIKLPIANCQLPIAAKLLFLLSVLTLTLASACDSSPSVKHPSVAGAFYPADKEVLSETVRGYLDEAEKSKLKNKNEISRGLKAIMVPHAGYVFSGKTAAKGFSYITGDYDYVVLVGTAHRSGEEGLLTAYYSEFELPNGKIRTDKKLLKKLVKKSKQIKKSKTAFLQEHSLEVQMVFLLEKLKGFKVIPFLTSNITVNGAKEAARAIYEELNDKKVLIVISADLSHYPPAEIAEKADREFLDAVVSMDPVSIEKKSEELLIRYMRKNLQTAACGEKAAIAGIELAKLYGADKAKLIEYTHSGKVSGDNKRVVGYGAVAFYREAAVKKRGKDALELDINAETKRKMLKAAREAIKNYIDKNEIMKIIYKDEIFDRELGLFVTLKKYGQLRGCIGMIEPRETLGEGIVNMACAAAFNDRRFRPVLKKELKDIEIEISILSPLKKISSPEEIEMGKHGVIIKKGLKTGIFLPQVAEETGWDKETFMSNLCAHKAGLPADAWKKDKGVDIYIFTVYSFKEGEAF